MTFILIVVGFFSSVRLVVQIMYAKKAIIHQKSLMAPYLGKTLQSFLFCEEGGD